MGEIIVFGSLNMDLVAKTHRLPERGETVSSSDFNIYPGQIWQSPSQSGAGGSPTNLLSCASW